MPEPTPAPPAKPTPPPPPAPDPALELRDAQIALEKKKQQEKNKEADKVEKLKAEKLKVEKEKAEKTKAENKSKELDKEKLAKEKKAQEEKERYKKKATEKAKAEKAEKADAAQAEALRQENLKRMQGMAGASGGENASGTALKSSGPSASYGGKIIREILAKTNNSDSTPGALTVVVFVRANSSGEIMNSRVITPSRSREFDDSVLRGIQKMERVPKDIDGRIPEILIREGLELTVSR
ncbi:TonB C-terminal domain-containing protein [Limnohabitans sp. 2KL-17]|uniref:TonB C-terminal domain-containing protein n=1 Tax=Limnohabitans sp. 2KL-17 TaxID=1100704 RepID=UPI001E3C6135|nr:TonB C-terminal domain-containing protein [Limnohabitans sp. 2KL-17]